MASEEERGRQPSEEIELVDRVIRGDDAAFDQLVARYATPIFRLGLGKTGSKLDAEDIMQRTLEKGWRHRDRLREGEPFGPWIFTIAHNETCNHLRSRHTRHGTWQRALAEARLRTEASPQDEALKQEQLRVLLLAVKALPDSYLPVIVCRFFWHLSVRETAAALGLPEGTVKTNTLRGKERLRRELSHRGWEADDA